MIKVQFFLFRNSFLFMGTVIANILAESRVPVHSRKSSVNFQGAQNVNREVL